MAVLIYEKIIIVKWVEKMQLKCWCKKKIKVCTSCCRYLSVFLFVQPMYRAVSWTVEVAAAAAAAMIIPVLDLVSLHFFFHFYICWKWRSIEMMKYISKNSNETNSSFISSLTNLFFKSNSIFNSLFHTSNMVSSLLLS